MVNCFILTVTGVVVSGVTALCMDACSDCGRVVATAPDVLGHAAEEAQQMEVSVQLGEGWGAASVLPAPTRLGASQASQWGGWEACGGLGTA